MNEQDYRSKYLKYKQKYTNALQNMQGGDKTKIKNALSPKPKTVYVVDENSYTNLKILGFDEGVSKEIKKDDTCVDKLVGISNINVIRIKPMKQFKYDTKGTKFVTGEITGFIKTSDIIYKEGLQKIDGSSAPKKVDELPFRGFTFGQSSENKYNSDTAYSQLVQELSYFTTVCALTNPHIVIFSADNKLCLCGALQQSTTVTDQ